MAKLEKSTREHLANLAINIVENKVYGTFFFDEHYNPDLIFLIFMPLIFVTDEWRTEMKRLYPNGFHLYEYIDKAGPRSINGMPTFMSMIILDMNHMPELKRLVKKYENFKKEFTGRPMSY